MENRSSSRNSSPENWDNQNRLRNVSFSSGCVGSGGDKIRSHCGVTEAQRTCVEDADRYKTDVHCVGIAGSLSRAFRDNSFDQELSQAQFPLGWYLQY